MNNQTGGTALHQAAGKDNTAVATLLLDRGASIDLANNVSHIVCMMCSRIDEGKHRRDGRQARLIVE